MMKGRSTIAFFMIIAGIYLFSNIFLKPSIKISHYLIYIIPVVVVIIIVSAVLTKFKGKITRVFVKSSIDSSLYTVQLEDGEYYFVGFKVVGKETTDQNVDYTYELKDAIESIQRTKTRYLKVALVTLLDPIPGTAILFYMKKDNTLSKEYLLNEAMILKGAIEGVAKHIALDPVDLKTDPILPIPKSLGSVVFSGYVGQKKFDIASDNTAVENYDIELGKTIGVNEIPVGIKTNDVFRHISIFGSTGSGKSYTSTLIARELAKRGFDVVIIDWQGEYKERLPEFNYYGEKNPLVINPLAMSEDEDVADVVEMMGDVLELTEPQKFLLMLTLLKLKVKKEFDVKSILDTLNEAVPDTSTQKDVKIALSRKIIMAFAGKGGELISSKQGLSYKELSEKQLVGGNIIDVSFIRNISVRRLYGMLVLKFLLEYFRETRNKTRKMYIVLEEAQNYLSKENIVITRALQEIRKFNVGLCIITQSPSSVDPEVLKNTNIKIIHSVKSNIDKDAIAKTLSLPQGEVGVIDKLGVGEAIVVAPNIRKEVIVKIKLA